MGWTGPWDSNFDLLEASRVPPPILCSTEVYDLKGSLEERSCDVGCFRGSLYGFVLGFILGKFSDSLGRLAEDLAKNTTKTMPETGGSREAQGPPQM